SLSTVVGAPAGTLSLSGNINAGGAGSSIVLNNSRGNITQSSGLLTADSIKITSGGSVGTASARITTAGGKLAVTAANNAFIASHGNLSLDASSVGSSLDVVSSKTITSVGTISAGSLKLAAAAATNAGLLLQSDLIVNNTAQLIADGSGDILQSG